MKTLNKITTFAMCDNNPCPNRLRTDEELDDVIRFATRCKALVWQKYIDFDLNREWGVRVLRLPSQTSHIERLMCEYLSSSRMAYMEGFNRHIRLLFEYERRYHRAHEWAWIWDIYLDEPPDELPDIPNKKWGERGLDRPALIHPANVALCERCRFDHPNTERTSISVAKHNREGAKVYQHPGGK